MKNIAKSVLRACVGLTAISVMSIANATTFDFSATNLSLTGGSSYNSISTSVDGIGLDITALTISNNGSGTIFSSTPVTGIDVGVYLSDSTSGNLGVLSNLFGGDGTNLDGGNGANADDLDEGLLFSFDRLVSLDYINFDSFSGSDDFNLTVDGISILVDFNATDTASSLLVSEVLGQTDEFNFNNIVGTEFLFWADGNSDSFRIDTLEVSAVPIPAAAWLFGSAILGLVGFSRRKRA